MRRTLAIAVLLGTLLTPWVASAQGAGPGRGAGAAAHVRAEALNDLLGGHIDAHRTEPVDIENLCCNRVPVDLALALAADCSGSVHAQHYTLQQRGYADVAAEPVGTYNECTYSPNFITCTPPTATSAERRNRLNMLIRV